ncbi:unnamed protein product [Arabis nemorensis]|uniref:Uncharacterized protein n=1 Tax=Arabis nemorensis TaxID=586526 RepID=A0A565AVS7_9BRAS|nr:unnamed protein product [Arabis nemorensis]
MKSKSLQPKLKFLVLLSVLQCRYQCIIPVHLCALLVLDGLCNCFHIRLTTLLQVVGLILVRMRLVLTLVALPLQNVEIPVPSPYGMVYPPQQVHGAVPQTPPMRPLGPGLPMQPSPYPLNNSTPGCGSNSRSYAFGPNSSGPSIANDEIPVPRMEWYIHLNKYLVMFDQHSFVLKAELFCENMYYPAAPMRPPGPGWPLPPRPQQWYP